MRGFANCKILKTIICFIDNIALFLPDNVRFLNALMFFFFVREIVLKDLFWRFFDYLDRKD